MCITDFKKAAKGRFAAVKRKNYKFVFGISALTHFLQPSEVFTREVEVLTFKSAPLAFFIDSAFPK